VARLQLDARFAGDLTQGLLVHPALADIATGYAMELIPGYSAEAGLWVPARYGRFCLYRPLPATVWSVATLSQDNELGPGFATFDITMTDEHGRVVAVVEGFTVKQLDARTDFVAALHDPTAAAPTAMSAAAPATRELSPAMARLAAQVDQGITPTEGGEALRRAVATGLPQVIVSSMDLTALQKAAAFKDDHATASVGLDRPNLDREFVAPATDIEKTLAGFWSELLGIEKIGTADSFFDLGGHSLVAVRLFRMIKKAYAVDFPISVLFEAPTIAQCARLIEQSGAGQAMTTDEAPAVADAQVVKARFTHVVPMHPGRNPHEAPLFICAGMFGNILNLRHLAIQIGQDRPVYGLQARGLYGGQAPHETFEEMAASYLEEVRTVQPHGPYLLSGFSGGGLIAYEMAQQLRAAGESADLVIMLDTPYPETAALSVLDRVTMKLQDLRRERGAFLMNWLRKKATWRSEVERKTEALGRHTTEQFHNEEIEAAFYRALARYEGRPYAGPVLLVRPKLEFVYRLRDGRLLDGNRSIRKPDNGWTPFLTDFQIREVPGNHDSMVLEPNVRVLAADMREALRMAGQTPKQELQAAE
jgi:thioesterase domain-containing protein/acyl carrier protein